MNVDEDYDNKKKWKHTHPFLLPDQTYMQITGSKQHDLSPRSVLEDDERTQNVQEHSH
jgi:hypothetical protein